MGLYLICGYRPNRTHMERRSLMSLQSTHVLASSRYDASDCAKGNREGATGLIKGRRVLTRDARSGPSRECERCRHRTGRRERAGPPPGGPIRSSRKNNDLPGSGPQAMDLHYGKNGYVLSGVERTGPTDGGPARVVRRGWAGGGWGRGHGVYRATRTRSAETDESASIIGPAPRHPGCCGTLAAAAEPEPEHTGQCAGGDAHLSSEEASALQSIAGAFPCNVVLHKRGVVPSAACARCGHPDR
jgi:hypothetical protein